MPCTRIKASETPEFKAMLLCSRREMSLSDVETVKHLIHNRFDWSRFIRLIREHRLFPPVYESLKIHFRQDAPCDAFSAIEAMRKENVLKCMTNMAAANRLSVLLKKNGIDHLFLKGFGLSQLLYGSPIARYSGDIDLIVHDTLFNKATRILEDNGYRQTQSEIELTEENRDYFLDLSHHLTFRCPASRASIELHFRFTDIRGSSPFDFAQAFRERRILTINGFAYPVMGKAHTLIHLALHGSMHFWKRLFWLKDLSDFFEMGMGQDEQRFFDGMRSFGLSRPAAEMLLLRSLLFGSHCPESVLAYKEKDWFLRSVPVMMNIYLKKPKSALSILLAYGHTVFVHKNFEHTRLAVQRLWHGKRSVKIYNPSNRSRLLNSIFNRTI